MQTGLTALKIDPLAEENTYNGARYCQWQVRDGVRQDRMQNPQSYSRESFLGFAGFQREPGVSSLCLNQQKGPCVSK